MSKHRLRVCVGYNDDGSPVIKQISGNSEIDLANKVVKTILASERKNEFIAGTTDTDRKAPTFKEYAEYWLSTYKVDNIRNTTLSGYKSILNSHAYLEWGNTPIDQIGTKEVQEFLNKRSDKSAKYLREMKTLLSQIFESARRDHHIEENPANDSRLVNPSKKKTIRNALSKEDTRDIITSLGKLSGQDKLYQAIITFTGMRRGEVLGLRWEDIDLKANVIHVRRNATYAKNQPEIGETKTESGVRNVPIIEHLYNYLLPLKDSGYIIGNGNQPLSLTSYRSMKKRIDRTIDLHGATDHVFRHTMGSLLDETGAAPKVIQDVLGHKDLNTTMNRYVHSNDVRNQEAMKKVNSFLGN